MMDVDFKMAKGKNCCICRNEPAYNYRESGNYYCESHRYQLDKYGEIKERTIRTKNEIIILKEYALIVLYNKENIKINEALIDINDIEKVKNFKWRLTHGYANNRMTGIALQNLIMDFVPNKINIVDHINRNRLDCRKSNLRIVDYFINGYNKGKQSNNTSGYPGVRWNKIRKKWTSTIKINKKNINLGGYETLEDAICARQNAELKYFGEIINRKHDINTIYKNKEK